MATYEPLNRTGGRRRRLLTLALLPVFAALAVWLLESGHWLVIYNDTSEPIGVVEVRIGSEEWTVPDLEPRESRRLRVRGREPAELFVQVPQWPAETSFRELHDWRETSSLTLRLGADHLMLSTRESAFWTRWLNW